MVILEISFSFSIRLDQFGKKTTSEQVNVSIGLFVDELRVNGRINFP